MTSVPDDPAAGGRDRTNSPDGWPDLAALFRALGHPVRLAILERLALQQEACCGDIVSGLPLAQSTVSQHLRVLKDAGLIACHARGRNCHYQVNRETLEHLDELWSGLRAHLATARDPAAITQNGCPDAETRNRTGA